MGDRSELSTLLELVTRVNEAVMSAKTDVTGIRSALEVLKTEISGRFTTLVEKVAAQEATIKQQTDKIHELQVTAAKHDISGLDSRLRAQETALTAVTTKVTVSAAIAGSIVAVLVAIISKGLGLR